MGKIVAANRGRRVHGVAFGEMDADFVFGLEQVKQHTFFAVLGAGRVARCRTNTLVFFAQAGFNR